MPDLQAHSPAMGQKDGEKWTAAVDLQPTIPKSDRLLARWLKLHALFRAGIRLYLTADAAEMLTRSCALNQRH